MDARFDFPRPQEVPWDFPDYARWTNAVGVALGTFIIFGGWLRFRSAEIALLQSTHKRDTCPARTRIAIEFFLVSYGIWTLTWMLSAVSRRSLDAVLSPLADKINSALILTSAVPLFPIALPRRLVRYAPAPEDNTLSARWKRRAPGFCLLAATLLTFGLLESLFPLRHWAMVLSIIADVILAIALFFPPGKRAMQVLAALLLVTYAVLQVPAHDLLQLTETSRRVCFLALAALKPCVALCIVMAIDQNPISNKQGRVSWDFRIGQVYAFTGRPV